MKSRISINLSASAPHIASLDEKREPFDKLAKLLLISNLGSNFYN